MPYSTDSTIKPTIDSDIKQHSLDEKSDKHLKTKTIMDHIPINSPENKFGKGEN